MPFNLSFSFVRSSASSLFKIKTSQILSRGFKSSFPIMYSLGLNAIFVPFFLNFFASASCVRKLFFIIEEKYNQSVSKFFTSSLSIVSLIPLYVKIDLCLSLLIKTTENPLVFPLIFFPKKDIFSFFSKSRTLPPFLSFPIFPMYHVRNPSREQETAVFVPPPPISKHKFFTSI